MPRNKHIYLKVETIWRQRNLRYENPSFGLDDRRRSAQNLRKCSRLSYSESSLSRESKVAFNSREPSFARWARGGSRFPFVRSEVPICVWQSRRCRFKTANALVVFHVPAAATRIPEGGVAFWSRRNAAIIATWRSLRASNNTALDARAEKRSPLARRVKSSPRNCLGFTMAGYRYCPATNVLIKFVGRAGVHCETVNGFRGTGGLAVGSERQRMSHSRSLSLLRFNNALKLGLEWYYGTDIHGCRV